LNLNSSTGAVNASSSSLGQYIVTYNYPSSNGCFGGSTTTTVTIISVQSPTAPANQMFCNAATVADLSVAGASAQWYLNATGGSPLAADTALVNGQTYFGTQTVGGCESALRVPVSVTIVVIQAPTVTAQQYFCASDIPTISDLAPQGPGINWYSSPLAQIPLAGTVALVDGASYSVTFIDNTTGCESNRSEITAYLMDSNAPEAILGQTYCEEDNMTVSNLVSTAEGTTFWFDSPLNGTAFSSDLPLYDGMQLFAANLDSETECYSSIRTEVNVTIIPCSVELNNLLTINQNELNNFITIKNIEHFPDNDLEIFNRYGALVWKGQNYDNIDFIFDGKANTGNIYKKNEYLPTGTYYYVLTYSDPYRKDQPAVKGFLFISNNE
jgi:hypothetical protein